MTTRPPASLGRRILPAVLMTTAASGLVAVLDQPSAGSAIDHGAGSTVLPDQGGAVAAGTTPPTVSSTVPAVVEQPQQTPTVVPLVPTTQPQPSATTTPTTVAASATDVCEGQTIDGPTIDTRWGPVQVEAVVSASGQICDVGAIQSPDSHGRSVRINDQALPILHTQVMKAQSASINGVSGATITSRGYQRSLQSILDNLGG
jgi:uncharacterized protein with FMN-binding domain